ncbi:MAG TPA: nucleotidyltransferase family protein [Clostridia bacterium]|nr:nucleotidyltransferase family protein [Clostridia bacterium]
MKAIILAGGRGERLKPITNKMPKPMVPVIGKPVLEYIILWLKSYGINEIALTLGYRADDIMNYFGDGRHLGVKLYHFLEEAPLGTAGSIKNAEEFLDEDFVVVSGDAFCDLNLDTFIIFHQNRGGIGTIAVKNVDDPKGFGIVDIDEEMRVVEFQEKPENPTKNTVNIGIYAFKQSILKYIPKCNYDFAKNLFPRLLEGAKKEEEKGGKERERFQLYAYNTDAYWSDIGTLRSYYATNSYVVDNFDMYRDFFV